MRIMDKHKLFPALLLTALLALPLWTRAQTAFVNGPLTAFSAKPLTSVPGNPDSGRAIVANRQVGLCLLCHSGPLPEEPFQGNLAPSLFGTGTRWTPDQLRLRIMNARQLNPQSIMPAYYSTEGLTRVSPHLQGKTILSAQQIEDVVAFLVTLK